MTTYLAPYFFRDFNPRRLFATLPTDRLRAGENSCRLPTLFTCHSQPASLHTPTTHTTRLWKSNCKQSIINTREEHKLKRPPRIRGGRDYVTMLNASNLRRHRGARALADPGSAHNVAPTALLPNASPEAPRHSECTCRSPNFRFFREPRQSGSAT